SGHGAMAARSAESALGALGRAAFARPHASRGLPKLEGGPAHPRPGVTGPGGKSRGAVGRARDGCHVLEDHPPGRVVPDVVAVDPVTNQISVPNASSNTVTVIDGDSNATVAILVGSQPDAVGVNPRTNSVCVANDFDNTVTVIAP